MLDANVKPGLIHNKRDAVIALCLTGFVAALSLRGAFSDSHYQSSRWLIEGGFLIPTRAVPTVNILFYVYLFWVGFTFCRRAQGRERLLVGGWFTGILMNAIQHIFTLPLYVAGDSEAIGMAVAFVAAVAILRERQRQAND